MNAIRIAASCSGWRRREHQRDQQDRAELADRAGREQIGAEPGPQLAAVAQDRDQRPDRRRRQRRARVEERDHDPGGGQHAADPVGEREREQPAPGAERQRPAADALEVDLVAGEEEQHPEPEVGEEVDEVVAAGEAEDLRADHDPEQELDHDHRRGESTRQDDDGDRGDRGDDDDHEERAGVDVDQARPYLRQAALVDSRAARVGRR